jgi:hypothetical protein
LASAEAGDADGDDEDRRVARPAVPHRRERALGIGGPPAARAHDALEGERRDRAVERGLGDEPRPRQRPRQG